MTHMILGAEDLVIIYLLCKKGFTVEMKEFALEHSKSPSTNGIHTEANKVFV